VLSSIAPSTQNPALFLIHSGTFSDFIGVEVGGGDELGGVELEEKLNEGEDADFGGGAELDEDEVLAGSEVDEEPAESEVDEESAESEVDEESAESEVDEESAESEVDEESAESEGSSDCD